ncbi:hypothetical protein OCT63_18350 [Vibrio sp. RW]|uniref:TcpQ domain-containing protein n=1 Tax=Vibrio sp. RW TaxID=2998833 RepID=UPI0022CDBBCF|nr:TcpQ domain-containing protein [Vibrio sp. RW]MDA0146191.1 hypothetical protein [Vibrio sp. RW]
MKSLLFISTVLLSTYTYAGVVFSELESDSYHGLNDSFTSTASNFNHSLPAHELLNGLAPKGWRVNLGPGVSNHQIYWEPAVNWRTAIMKLQKLNQGIYFAVNEQDRVIAASKSREQLTHLQTRNPNLWVLSSKLSLRKNLLAWNQQSDIEIIWSAEDDFPVLSNSVLVGDLTGKGGVLDRVLQGTLKSEAPLWVSYSPEIGAARILPGGSTEKVSQK